MTLSPARAPGADAGSGSAVRRLTVTLYGYVFLDDFVLLYPVYALLFSDTGLSLWQISSLFALWSITGVLLEVPSGAWADAVSRRTLLWLGTAAHRHRLRPVGDHPVVRRLRARLRPVGRRGSARAPARWRHSSTTSWTGSAPPTGTRASWAGPGRRVCWP